MTPVTKEAARAVWALLAVIVIVVSVGIYYRQTHTHMVCPGFPAQCHTEHYGW